ncbi:50S ribosomal protein L21 [Candidatus Peregrinibacteria bacterium CG22_combo_CG10-13_8_21_14_all_44_10]|nr:MAG: 50S ribosomal protein L21 [Candidatus Peregrinibacteria bacterium CG2_30_44_17]PIP65928.1 MAG: 50S ribosomal protein L21 [Candidatus Peregrinibacteria bacterium CG22_combo_CG10-13_8_21_14_all_44_10]PIS04199.1 MAG: 50S ribosomal protein L21 [Candidatus Peregrinibacteria bacterium CG10_big_fil_rev_8_21_14_0_10_44_7]PIX79778.1 MAG: 50S ribosomal protein L21 [Candidatus Peregrinibacteria bacterium CG_4_10_14_3_um_filter_44_21]PJB88346.1 MAG: 50S ribosomal protein L21 [Candidatus Peregriniba
MFAVIEIGGKQYQVEEKEELLIEKIDATEGQNLTVKTVVLFAKSDSDVEVGMPYVQGATVELKVLEEVKGDKIRVFKMKAKKRYARTQGHRQKYWNVKVLKITKVAGKKPAAPKEDDKATEEKPAKKKAAPKK